MYTNIICMLILFILVYTRKKSVLHNRPCRYWEPWCVVSVGNAADWVAPYRSSLYLEQGKNASHPGKDRQGVRHSWLDRRPPQPSPALPVDRLLWSVITPLFCSIWTPSHGHAHSSGSTLFGQNSMASWTSWDLLGCVHFRGLMCAEQSTINTARALKSWSATHVGSVRLQLATARVVVVELDVAQESRALSPAEIDLRRDLKRTSLGLASLSRTIARQTSQMRFLDEGDANTRFFHLQVCHRNRKNRIPTIQHEGQTFTEEQLGGV